MEFVIAEVEGGVDWFEWFKVDIDLALFALVGNDSPAVNDKAVSGAFVVQFEALLGGGDGAEDGESIDS